MIAADYPFLDIVWTMFIFFAWVIWFWILITVFADIFRRHDTSGIGKVLWMIFVIVLPFLGVFIYLIANHDGMTQRNIDRARAQQASMGRLRENGRLHRQRSVGDREGEGPARLGRDQPGGVRRNQAEGARSVVRERSQRMEEIGPVDYAIVGFPGNRFRGEIAPAIADLVESGHDPHHRHRFRRQGRGAATPSRWSSPSSIRTCRRALEKAGIEVSGLFNEDDLMDAAESLEPNSSAALLVWENVWARKVTQAMRDAGGELLAFDRLPHDIVQAAREWALEQASA